MGYTYSIYQKFIYFINFLFFNILILQNNFFYYKLIFLLKRKTNKKNIYKIILIYDI